MSGVFVTFMAPITGASGTFPNGTTSDLEITDSTGKATSAPFTANLMAGGIYFVFATVNGQHIGFYYLTNTTGPPARIVAMAGWERLAGVKTQFQNSLIAFVTDQGGNPVSGAPVTFTAPSSGPSVQFQPASANQVTVNTSNGQATTFGPTANAIAGAYVVLATVPGVAQPAVFNLANVNIGLTSLATGTVQVTRGGSATLSVNVGTTPSGIALGQPVALSCSGSLGLSCAVNPTTIQVGNSGATATITINAAAGSRSIPPEYGRPIAPIFSMWIVPCWLAALSLFWVARPGELAGRRLPALLTLVLLVTLAAGLVSCSGGSSDSANAGSGAAAGPGSVTVSANGDGLANTITITVNVN